ncbi:2-oxo acid dehydrogenase subunit E2 [Sporosarcina sp. ACRSM]|uniref:dihydrolipoamide acetyltransferase family protein n=1 Tax=Sporosarcina sp. ACRSM TaxID=2918216 RepID=UPI001EF4425F|nr:dihydrolipoamide acetyltransferase family protein [Sporosarcina sp. ACRSM]MCG7335056.1 2-oxo acid dehydrogenase subunit E2 [Sporosarcina sp. ACRSM]
MAENILMPQLGESITEGTITKWMVNAGDKVNKYDPICEVNTDKVNAEVPSTFSGIISEIIVQEWETVEVGTLICTIKTEGESEEHGNTVDTEPVKHEEPLAVPHQEGMKKRLSPAVLKLAEEHHIDISTMTGTGNGGRITRKDIQAAIEGKGQETATAVKQAVKFESASTTAVPAAKEQKPLTSIEIPVHQQDQVIPVTAVRRTIADRMLQSKHEAPHAWTMAECDITNLVNYRSKIKDEFKQQEGFNLTFMPFFIKAVVEALKEFPMLNSQWAGDQIIVKKGIHISIAVATDDALYVPVIKDADQKSIFGLAKAVNDLAEKCKTGKLTIEDMTGGTFTVNNTGSFGSILSAPIINQPQAAIMSVEAITKRPVVVDNMIAIRDMMNLCLSLDHRVLDGLVCGRFLQSVKQKLQIMDMDIKLY